MVDSDHIEVQSGNNANSIAGTACRPHFEARSFQSIRQLSQSPWRTIHAQDPGSRAIHEDTPSCCVGGTCGEIHNRPNRSQKC